MRIKEKVEIYRKLRKARNGNFFASDAREVMENTKKYGKYELKFIRLVIGNCGVGALLEVAKHRPKYEKSVSNIILAHNNVHYSLDLISTGCVKNVKPHCDVICEKENDWDYFLMHTHHN